MTVKELMMLLQNHSDNEVVYYFDSEAGEDCPLYRTWLSFKEAEDD